MTSLKSTIQALDPIVYYRFSDPETGAITGSVQNSALSTFGSFNGEACGDYKFEQLPLPNRDVSSGDSSTSIALSMTTTSSRGYVECYPFLSNSITEFSTGMWVTSDWRKIQVQDYGWGSDKFPFMSYMTTTLRAIEAYSAGPTFNVNISGSIISFNIPKLSDLLFAGEKHFLVFDWSQTDNKINLYDNGVLLDSKSLVRNALPPGGNLIIGSQQIPTTPKARPAGSYANTQAMTVSNFFFFDRRLTGTEIENIYKAGTITNKTLVSQPSNDQAIEPIYYLQRIYDSGLGEFIYYNLSEITASPNPSQTVPNGSGTYVVSSHEILETMGS